jgi:predicted RNase H-like HicB family nuclease
MLSMGGEDMRTFRLTVDLIPEEEGGFTVYCPELEIYTQGETEDECIENAREAIALHLEELGERAVIRPVIRREIEVVGGA